VSATPRRIDRRVVITGAAGRIGTAITTRLAKRWNIVATDRPGAGAEALDVTDADACREAFARADAVVHLAAVPDQNAGWDALLPANVIGVYNVAAAATAVVSLPTDTGKPITAKPSDVWDIDRPTMHGPINICATVPHNGDDGDE
jgi:nucleoside-diphosphate-sugar epimerase